MKKTIFLLALIAKVLFSQGQSLSFGTFMNPVIPGDHPDCTLTKVGNDFYTTGSSFNVTPVIYHSTDLVHWEAISQPVSAAWSGYGDTAGGGCWGGHMVYYKGKYWNYFGRAFVMYFVTADDPKGPWSSPTRVKDPTSISYTLGADNSIFIDDDNKWYLLAKNGKPNNGIVELGDDGQPTGLVYNLDWLNPDPTNQYSWAEGPVMWKFKGYYYYSFARDVAGGQKVMRSKTLTADQASWEMLGDLFNENDPQKPNSLFASPNHASPAVLLADSTSWVLHPLYAKSEWRGQGRQGLLNQVKYNTPNRPVADYPINQAFTAPKLPSSGIPWMVPKSDTFNDTKLNPEWSFVGFTATSKWSLTERPGWLRLSPRSSTRLNTIVKNDGEHNYSLITKVAFSPKSQSDEAGIWIMRGDEKMAVKLGLSLDASGKKIISYSFETTKNEVQNEAGDTLWLKLERINHKINGYYSANGFSWKQIGQSFDVSVIDAYTDPNFGTWEGTRQGPYVQGVTNAYYDLYIYRDAYTPILAECPANQFGMTKTLVATGISALDNIHQNDWALYAGVEFGNEDYPISADSVEFTTSSANREGIIEVWLDSIGTGTKISECKVGKTGSFNKFATFKAAVSNVSGRHDVYLKFLGEGTTKLFILKSFRFFSNDQPTATAALKKESDRFSVFPNPATDQITIQADFAFSKVEIFNLGGASVFSAKIPEKHEFKFNVNLPNGVYALKISNNATFGIKKIVINN